MGTTEWGFGFSLGFLMAISYAYQIYGLKDFQKN